MADNNMSYSHRLLLLDFPTGSILSSPGSSRWTVTTKTNILVTSYKSD